VLSITPYEEGWLGLIQESISDGIYESGDQATISHFSNLASAIRTRIGQRSWVSAWIWVTSESKHSPCKLHT
jgi:hypothetical protein